jgi:tetratricopeptide (TPR) repeat protein
MNYKLFKPETKYFNINIILGLLLILSINNQAIAANKPLDTIGEPTKLQSDAEISSPFSETSDTEEMTDDSDTESIPETSPFKIDSSSSPFDQPEESHAEPVIEDIKTTTQEPAISPIADPNNPLGLAAPYQQLEKSKELLKNNRIAEAKAIVEPTSEWLTELTEYHIQLFRKLNSIESAKNQAQVEKRIALDSALLRDKAFYQLALIYLAENNEKKAIKYFIEVIKSQPRTELGLKSYEILQQIGFTEKVRLVPQLQ